jgi:hypothetical protein
MQNIIKIDSNSWVGYEYEAISFGSHQLNLNLPTQGESRLMAFLLSRANGSAITRIGDSWLKPYTDEPLNEPRWGSVNQATTKTGKMGYRKIGRLKLRLIIELINYVDSRLRLAMWGVTLLVVQPWALIIKIPIAKAALNATS